MFWKQKIGNQGESLAVQFLRKNGAKIVEKSYRCKAGEIDIIARVKKQLCFIEVKTRNSELFGRPEESVDAKKQKQMAKTALWYLQSKKSKDTACRFDVISIQQNGHDDEPEIRWIQNAFELNPWFRY